MQIKPISSRIIRPPHDSLDELWAAITPQLTERSVVAVTSKVVAIAEGRCIPLDKERKDELIKAEADLWLPRDQVPGEWVMHALKDGILAASCGLDESNADGYFVYWPSDPTTAARQIWERLRAATGLKEIGVIITDSRSTPLRRGVTGYALAYWGFKPLVDYRGLPDLFGHELRVSQSNVPDALGAAATFVMGEGAERQPAAILTDLPATVQFQDGPGEDTAEFSTLVVPVEEDLFRPFIADLPWEPGGSGHHQ